MNPSPSRSRPHFPSPMPGSPPKMVPGAGAKRTCGLVLSALALQGCSRAVHSPSIPIFGSYFPAWVLCAVGGIIIAVALRFIFVAAHIDEHLPAAPLVYLCFAISAGIGLWLIWAGQA